MSPSTSSTAKRPRKTTKPAEIVVGRITGVFGVRGELKFETGGAGRRLVLPGAQLRCVRDDASWPVRINTVRPHKGRLLIRIDGVEDANVAAGYTGTLLYADRAAVILERGEYLDDDLIGLSVFGTDGRAYGQVERIEHYPSSDMLIVAGRMVPMVRAIVAEIDLDRRRITIDPPQGLLE